MTDDTRNLLAFAVSFTAGVAAMLVVEALRW